MYTARPKGFLSCAEGTLGIYGLADGPHILWAIGRRLNASVTKITRYVQCWNYSIECRPGDLIAVANTRFPEEAYPLVFSRRPMRLAYEIPGRLLPEKLIRRVESAFGPGVLEPKGLYFVARLLPQPRLVNNLLTLLDKRERWLLDEPTEGDQNNLGVEQDPCLDLSPWLNKPWGEREA